MHLLRHSAEFSINTREISNAEDSRELDTSVMREIPKLVANGSYTIYSSAKVNAQKFPQEFYVFQGFKRYCYSQNRQIKLWQYLLFSLNSTDFLRCSESRILSRFSHKSSSHSNNFDFCPPYLLETWKMEYATILIAFLFNIILHKNCEGSHFRGGTVSWKHIRSNDLINEVCWKRYISDQDGVMDFNAHV